MALTRFHFVAGMPHSGARHLMSILAQNPRFAAILDSGAAEVLDELQELNVRSGSALATLDPATRAALMRGALDAVHHARPMDAAVFDHSPLWVRHIENLAQLLPMSRFIVMVRDPAAIAGVMADEAGKAQKPLSLLGPNGAIGAPMAQIESAMNSAAAERLLLIDYDRLIEDPHRVLRTVYTVLREPEFDHDFRSLPKPEKTTLQLQGLRRRVISFSKPGGRTGGQQTKPLWQRSSGTAATLLLRNAG